MHAHMLPINDSFLTPLVIGRLFEGCLASYALWGPNGIIAVGLETAGK
jgi:hypothetical protein